MAESDKDKAVKTTDLDHKKKTKTSKESPCAELVQLFQSLEEPFPGQRNSGSLSYGECLCPRVIPRAL